MLTQNHQLIRELPAAFCPGEGTPQVLTDRCHRFSRMTHISPFWVGTHLFQHVSTVKSSSTWLNPSLSSFCGPFFECFKGCDMISRNDHLDPFFFHDPWKKGRIVGAKRPPPEGVCLASELKKLRDASESKLRVSLATKLPNLEAFTHQLRTSPTGMAPQSFWKRVKMLGFCRGCEELGPVCRRCHHHAIMSS